ncbi:hypothetical protein [Nocardia sp. NPDC050406]|uniref:hypothetical protein n=1 Tax=Nocardia sp. NPDC050406 TaxID=3364318 RepID=UPI0037ACCFB4
MVERRSGMDSVTAQVRDAVDQAVAMEEGTAVVSADSGTVQWLASPDGVFHIEVLDAAPQRRRTRWQRLRGRAEPAASGFDERKRAALANLGFAKANEGVDRRTPEELRPYVLRADAAGLDRDHVVHVIVTVLHDVLEVRDSSGLSVEIF